MNDMIQKINQMKNRKVLVVGDIMLDEYVFGEVERVSPEAPVPVLKVRKEETRLGGAANTALNISTLGGKPMLVGFIGLDGEGRELLSILKKEKIPTSLILKSGSRRTTLKVRAMEKFHLLRIDYEDANPLDQGDEKRLIALLKREAKNADAIILSDYGKGILTGNVLSELRKLSGSIRAKIIVDPKPREDTAYKGFYLVTPNEKEALEMAGRKKASIESLGKELVKKTKSRVLITRGKNGMSLFERNRLLHFPTQAKEVFDVSGAGDTVVSAIGLALASSLSLEEACILANAAAGIVVGKKGTASVLVEELKNEFAVERMKFKDLPELKALVTELKRKGKKIVFTNGCFDLLHLGHVKMLEEARRFGDVLIVALNSDKSVRELKGNNRPILSQKERAEILSALRSVDFVVVFDEKRIHSLISALKPDIYVKGGDYRPETLDKSEKRLLDRLNIKIKLTKKYGAVSTTGIISKISTDRPSP